MADDRNRRKDGPGTLKDEDIQSRQALPRRSLLKAVAPVAVGATALVGGSREALAVTDSDSGPYADPAGAGRGYTGITDSDGGAYADPAGRGRGGGGGTGITDSDTGAYADPVGYGRGSSGTGITDNDSGAYADPVGYGRGGGGTGITDNDAGAYADPVGYGRGRVVRVNQLVVSIQTNLSNLGFNPGPVDGVYGQRTRSAIIAFQRYYGFPVTGLADQNTMAQLQQVR